MFTFLVANDTELLEVPVDVIEVAFDRSGVATTENIEIFLTSMCSPTLHVISTRKGVTVTSVTFPDIH